MKLFQMGNTRKSRNILASLLLAVLFVTSVNLYAQGSYGKKALSIEDYDRWRGITAASISDNGIWITFSYTTRNADDTLYVKNLMTNKEYQIPSGQRPRISDDSKWIAYMIALPYEEAEKLREDKKPVTSKAELMNFGTGEKVTWDNAQSFTFSKGSKYLAVKKTKSDRDAKHNGTDMILRNLELGYDDLIGSVGSFAFNKPGALLAYTIDAADKNGNGLTVIDLSNGARRPLDSENLDYAQMAWDEEGTALMALKGEKKEGDALKTNTLVMVTGLAEGEPVTKEYKADKESGFPENMVISEKGALSWSKDHSLVFFGIKEQDKEPEKKKNGKKVADVDIWHWADDRIQSVQMVQATRDKNFTYRSAYSLNNNRFIELTDTRMRTISLTKDGKWGVGQDDRDYISDWEERRADYYRVNTSTGERTLMFREMGRTLGLSPDSKRYLYWKDKNVWLYNIETGENTNLTKNGPADFRNKEFDRPGEIPPYGVTGWTKDGKHVILTHKYDLFLQPLDGGKATPLTNGLGEKDKIVFRYVNIEPRPGGGGGGRGGRGRGGTNDFIDTSKPMMFSTLGQMTKKAGYSVLKDGKTENLVYDDKRFGRPIKAKNADKILYTIQTFRDFPDYYVSDTKFTNPIKVTDANPQQSEFNWGRRILFEFKNKKGVKLQGTLAIPDTYVEGEKLPMHVNFYEKNSQNLNRYTTPRIAGSPNFAGLVSNGYLVMQPDIYFNTGTTHSDMLDCVEAAVKKVIEMGYADPDRISLHGHSFSGQGSAYISTRSNMFAAIVYGAGATNLVSDFNQLWKTSGTSQHRYDIYGQGRFGTNPYDDLKLYQNESAIFHVRSMNTPLMILHGTADGSVEWLQAVEFYNALRFNGKNVILLSYPGEAHGLRRYENQKDYQTRMMAFLDHYLKDKPAPDWMVHGVPFLKKKK